MNINFKHAAVPEIEIKKGLKKLEPYLSHLNEVVKKSRWDVPECLLNLPHDADVLAQSRTALKGKNLKKLKYVVVIGIGGSNLGTKALYDALYGSYDAFYPERLPKCFFADTTDVEWLSALDHFLRQHVTSTEEILLIAISKSGSTTETIVNLDLILESGTRRFSKLSDRVVGITATGSKFWNLLKAGGVACADMQPCVSGRYSVFSAVGLVPLLALGIDVEKFREGARDMQKICLEAKPTNFAARTAVTLAALKTKGVTTHDTFVFHPELESCGRWYRQLLAESIGKEKNNDGKIVHEGILPTVSVGSTDLHSVSQLYLGGPQTIFTSFLWSRTFEKGNQIGYSEYSSLIPGITDKYSIDVMNAILQGTERAYVTKKHPFLQATLPDISAYSIGAWMQYAMIQVMCLGYLFNVNPFDQPEVELYKSETRKILGK